MLRKMQMFHEADLIVMQSYTKGFGLVALEAIPAGRLCFTSVKSRVNVGCLRFTRGISISQR